MASLRSHAAQGIQEAGQAALAAGGHRHGGALEGMHGGEEVREAAARVGDGLAQAGDEPAGAGARGGG